MYGNDEIYRTVMAERERDVAELLRERQYRKAFQPEPLENAESVPAASPVPVWRRVAYALHLPLPRTSPRSA